MLVSYRPLALTKGRNRTLMTTKGSVEWVTDASSQEAFHCFALQAHKSTRRRHSYAATITSALLFAFTGDFLANRKLFSRFLLFIAYECLLVAVKVAYQLLRDTPPFEVKLQRKRVNFLGRKIVADEPDERKEDSDDESEDEEARHPLIVHDRDPEQNLEALRNPDRYRQNLA